MNTTGFRLLIVLIVLAVAGYLVVSTLSDTGTQAPTVATTDADETGGANQSDVAAVPPPVEPHVEEAVPAEVPSRERVREIGADADFGSGSGMMSGRVVNRAGAPVEGAVVSLAIGPAGAVFHLPAARKRTGRSAETDSDGTFTIDGLPAASNYIVIVNHPDYSQSELAGVVVPENEPRLVPDIVLGPGAKVFGVVRDTVGGLVAGAEVELWNQLEANFAAAGLKNPYKTTRTDTAGHYEFSNIHFNAMELVVSAKGYASSSKQNTQIFGGIADREIDFVLSPALQIAGVVVDAAGSPIEKATVNAYQIGQAREAGTSKGKAYSKNDGSFALVGLAQGTYNISAEARGFSDKQHGTVESGAVDVRIILERRGAVTGQVVDSSTRQPLASFRLNLMIKRSEGDPIPTPKTRNVQAADGAYEFDDIDPGTYVMEASAAGYAPSRSEPFQVRRGETTGNVLVPMGRGGIVKGVVVDSTGQAISGALVKLNPNNFVSNAIIEIFQSLPTATPKREFKTVTDGGGAFVLDFLVPGTYQIDVAKQGLSNTAINDVVVGEGLVTDLGRVTVSVGGMIIGQCVDASGRPFSDGQVQCSTKTGNFVTVRPDYDGRFEIKNLQAGEYELSLNPDSIAGEPVNPLLMIIYAQDTKRTVQVRVGQTTQATLQLPPPKG